jgi:hypothetical protein
VDFAGHSILKRWQSLFGIEALHFGLEGQFAGGWEVRFSGGLQAVPAQGILTDYLVDLIYPVEPGPGATAVAYVGRRSVGTQRVLPAGGIAAFLGFRPRDDQSASLGREVRSWFEILLALGAYPKNGKAVSLNDNPDVISRTTPYVACRFPNGATTVAAHYRAIEETWPGGFHRDAKQDAEILAKNPLPSAKLELRDFCVNGHCVTFDGSLCLAFRLDERGSLAAFAGHNCRGITVDGREFGFAREPVALAAWAPVVPQRRVPGGAIMELWIHGQTEIQVPLPAGVTRADVYFQGARPGSFGEKITSECSGGILRFSPMNNWPQKHLFLVAR